uniref:MEG-14 n=1 Tax=Schistosoma mansoni TaxID=6183 RepID=A0A5K4F7K5_SCHMA
MKWMYIVLLLITIHKQVLAGASGETSSTEEPKVTSGPGTNNSESLSGDHNSNSTNTDASTNSTVNGRRNDSDGSPSSTVKPPVGHHNESRNSEVKTSPETPIVETVSTTSNPKPFEQPILVKSMFKASFSWFWWLLKLLCKLINGFGLISK